MASPITPGHSGRIRRIGLLLLLVLGFSGVTGCYGDSDAFIAAKAKHECIRAEECTRTLFETVYGDDRDRCRDAVEDFWDDLIRAGEFLGGEYDPEVARECVATSRSNRDDCSIAATSEINSACTGVVN